METAKETIKSSKSIEKKLPLGKLNEKKIEKLDKLAEKVEKSKALERENATEEAKKEARKEVFKTLGSDAESVSELIKIRDDKDKPMSERDKAKMELDILAKAVYWQMKNGTTDEQDLLGNGIVDSKKIDVHLPVEYKGLGESIVKAMITSPEVKKIIGSLSRKMEHYSNKTMTTRELAREEIKDAMKKINDLTGEGLTGAEKKAFEDDVAIVMAYLAEESGVYDERNVMGNEEAMVMYYDDEGKPISEGRDYRISKDNLAYVVKNRCFLRWDDATPPAWYDKLEKAEKAKTRVMIQFYLASRGVEEAGKDLDKIIGNFNNWGFTHEQMNALLDDDMKAVMSKLLKTLCTQYVDQNGYKSLIYKEKCYKYDYKNGYFVNERGEELKPGERKVEVAETEVGKRKAVRTIDQDVMKKLGNIDDFKDELAVFLADRNGGWEYDIDGHKTIPNASNRLMAATAWNIVHSQGDSSLWDRMRIVPTWNGVISDAIRTLNPEAKALSKWMALKSGLVKSDEYLPQAEDFAGNMSEYVNMIRKMERDTGKPLDGKEFMLDKLVDGKVSLLSYKTYYGFLDFVNQGRDLKNEKGIAGSSGQDSLGTILYRYNDTVHDKDEKLFRGGQSTFMNEHRDSLEGAIMINKCIQGKAEIKDFGVFARELRGKMGMVTGIEFNKESPFSYVKNPKLWRDLLVGYFGFDKRVLSSEWIRIKNTYVKPGEAEPYYNLFLYNLLTDICGLNGNDININEIMRLCGVDVKDSEKGYGFLVTMKDRHRENGGKRKTQKLMKDQRESYNFGLLKEKMKDVITEINGIDKYEGYALFDMLKRKFDEAIADDDELLAKRLAKAIREFVPTYEPTVGDPEPTPTNSEPTPTTGEPGPESPPPDKQTPDQSDQSDSGSLQQAA